MEYLTLHYWDAFTAGEGNWLCDSLHIAGVEATALEAEVGKYTTLLSMLLVGSGFPGFGTILLMIWVAICVEVVEYVAGVWGVKNRGGSNWAGLAALVGGVAGLILGTAIPVPVLGSLLGMTAGSFGFVYGVERYRLKRASPAVHIALGAVVARFFVVLLKVGVTLGMMAAPYLLMI